MRVRAGDEVSVFDGDGGEYRCVITDIGKSSAKLGIIEQTQPASPESSLDLTLAAAILKHDRFDLVIQKAVELGVATLIPLDVVRFDVRAKDAAKRLDRWRRIALEATKQCGRARLMKIGQPTSVKDVIRVPDPSTTVMFSERDGGALPLSFAGSRLTAIIGPVGGWDDSELKAAQDRGISIVTLRGRVLRAETAAIAIAAILQHRFGDLN
jgi:16S rRNA (uracil1498-N3)-methyltransferase